MPALLVNDGNVLVEQLHTRAYDEKWLEAEILKVGAKGSKEVYVATMDSSGQLTCSLKNPSG